MFVDIFRVIKHYKIPNLTKDDWTLRAALTPSYQIVNISAS